MGVLILGGTTAAGKSDLAIELAETYGAAVVSADAMTVYRGMDVGTAKPAPEVLARCPHACVDVVAPDEPFSVAEFVQAFDEVSHASEHVIVVGGTPFYLSALVRPLASLPAADEAVRADLERLEAPHATLMEIDPESAARLHPNDRVRVIRALEVHALTGQTMTALHAQGAKRRPIEGRTVWIDSDELDERIEARLKMMVAAGYVQEVRKLLAAGYGRDLKPFQSFAYRHIVEHVLDGLELDEAIRRTGRDTRRFARKQRTWSRGMGWVSVGHAQVREAAKAEFNPE